MPTARSSTGERQMDLRRGSIVASAARSQSAAFSQGSIATKIASRDLIRSVNQGDGTEFHPKEQGSRKIATQLARTTFRKLV